MFSNKLLKNSDLELDLELIEMYTDGSCFGNPGPGGWGVVIYSNKRGKEEYSGSEQQTTSNRMELTAVIEGLNVLKGPCLISLYTDSLYVKNGISKWISYWKKNGWKTSSKKQVRNIDLWKKLDRAASQHNLHSSWIKSHVGIHGNHQADLLARKAINQMLLLTN